MTDYTVSLGANANLLLRLTELSYDIPTNTSLVNAQLYLIRVAGARYSNYTNNSWSINIDGQVGGGSGTYDIRTGDQLKLSQNFTIGHNPDGTRSISVSGSFSDPHGNIGSGTASGTFGLTTIPRASTPSFQQPSGTPVTSVDAGTTVTIQTNRADASFTHDITYAIGASSGTIATGVGASTTWAVPITLLTEFPNSASGNVTITTVTKNSGGTTIGTTAVTLPITAPSTATPDFTTVTNSDTNSSVVSIVGAYVQGLSTLALAITGAVGYQGSTISSYKIDVAGQTINASSGTTTAIGSSGTVAIVGTVTDSRGRTKSKTVNVTVLAYALPVIDNTVFQLRRSNNVGVVDPAAGTYVRTDLKGNVSSLINGTEKNAITYKIESRQRGTTTWTTKTTTTPGGLSFNSFDVEGTYDVALAWEFQITVSDKFSSVIIGGLIATAAIFMHWNGSIGLALNKFWEQGALDVNGQIYQNNGYKVLSEERLATVLDVATGTSTTKVVTPASLSASSGANRLGTVTGVVAGNLLDVTFVTPLADGTTHVSAFLGLGLNQVPAGATVVLTKSGTSWYIIDQYGATQNGTIKAAIPLQNNWRWYHDVALNIAAPSFSPPIAYRTSTGQVFVDGLLAVNPAPLPTTVGASGTVVAILPAPFRPLQEYRTAVWGGNLTQANTSYGIIVGTDGTIKLDYGSPVVAPTLFSLSGITFNNDATLTRTAIPLNTGISAYTTGGATPRYAVDAAGRFITEGMVQGTPTVNPATSMWAITTAFPAGTVGANAYLRWTYELGAGNRVARIDIPGAPVATSLKRFSVVSSAARTLSLDFSTLTDAALAQYVATGNYLNSWTSYGSGWLGEFAYQLSDGSFRVEGLVQAGTLANPMFSVPGGMAPKWQLIFLAEGGDSIGRIDVKPDSTITHVSGTAATFYSLENLQWIPNQKELL